MLTHRSRERRLLVDAIAVIERKHQNGGGGQMELGHFAMHVVYVGLQWAFELGIRDLRLITI
jgi:hypothetical protein